MRAILSTILLTLLFVGTASVAEAGWDEGVAAFKAGNYSAAAKEFQAVVDERPDWATGHVMLGQTLLKLNRSADALASLRKAYDLEPNNVQIQLGLAKAYVDNGKYGDAATLLERMNADALKGPNKDAYQSMLTVALEKSGRGDQARAAMRQTALAKPNDADAQYRYGIAAFNANETADAVKHLGKAVQLTPNDAKRREAYAKALIRQARETENAGAKKSAYAKAAEQATALVRQEASYDNLLLLGEVQLGAKNYAAAADALGKAAAKKSNDWLSLYYLSQAQTQIGRYAEAEESLRKALAANPSDRNEKRIWQQIGFVNEKLKRYDQAKSAYTKAGDNTSLARIEKNQQIAAENAKIEQENAQIEAMEAERRRLEAEMRELEGPPPY